MTIDTWVNIVAIIVGLVGVFIALQKNGRLAREQQERQWNYDAARAERRDIYERTTLQSALRIELQAIHSSIRISLKLAGEKSKEDAPSLLMGSPEFNTEIYQAALPRIGILPDDQIRVTARYYGGRQILPPPPLERAPLGTLEVTGISE